MVVQLDHLLQISSHFGAIVLDQWGVLHDGTRPYPGVAMALDELAASNTRLAVLSNSGKRAALNSDRIAGMGIDVSAFDTVMTSGEALWLDIAAARVSGRDVFVIAADPADASAWADGLDLNLVSDLDRAELVLLMGIAPETAQQSEHLADLGARIKALGLTVYCTNPDRASPRAGGVVVPSPGAVAHTWAEDGVRTVFYGKPHKPIFQALETALDLAPHRIAMVGDSLEHDIAGGHRAGWATVFIQGGLHASLFASSARGEEALASLAAKEAAPLPDYTLPSLR